jgi:molybdopterin converting factor small subunit
MNEVRVLLPSVLVALFPGAPRELAVQAGTVGEAIAVLDARWPGMRDRLCESPGRLRRHINVFVEGERATPATPLRAGGEMIVMTAISGG